MSKVIIEQENQYMVHIKSAISNFDRKVLIRLYQPIVGPISISLYSTLLSELSFDNTVSKDLRTFGSLLKLMNVNMDEFRSGLTNLEGVGLVKTKKHIKNDYWLIELFNPLTPQDFFNNPLLEPKLLKILGKEEFDRNKTYFSFAKINAEEFEDVSSEFSDVFTVERDSHFDLSTNQMGHQSSSIKLDFDEEAFFMKLKQLGVDKKSIKEKDIENIAILAYTYKLPAVDMATFTVRSLNDNGIDLKTLRRYCESKKGGRKDPVVTPFVNKYTGNENVDKLINEYNSFNSKDYLLKKNKNTQLTNSEMELIDNLRDIYRFSDPLINCLLDYVIKNNDGKLINNYVEKIASSMARKGIGDSYAAYLYLNKVTPQKTIKETTKQVNNDEEVDEKEYQEALDYFKSLKEKRKNG